MSHAQSLRSFLQFGLLCAILFATPAFAIDTGVQDGLKRGCLFAYLPDENLIYFKIDFSRRRLLGDEARAVDTAPIFSSKHSGSDSGSINIEKAMELGKQCSSVSIRRIGVRS